MYSVNTCFVAGPEETDSTTQLNTLTEAVVKRENNSQTDERRVGQFSDVIRRQ